MSLYCKTLTNQLFKKVKVLLTKEHYVNNGAANSYPLCSRLTCMCMRGPDLASTWNL